MTGILKLMSILVLAFLTFASPGEAAQKVLFDVGHGEPFKITEKGPLQLSLLAETIQGAGAQVATTDQPFSDASLSGADALIISGAFSPLHPAEIDAVIRFIESGGKVAVMLHIAPPLAPLLGRLQVAHTNGVVRERSNIIEEDPLRFRIDILTVHPVLKELADFSVHGAWGLINTGDQARIIAASSPLSWVDVNNDKKQANNETASFGVAVAGEFGKGEFVVFGDDAIFQNKFLEGNNKILATNLANWLK